MNTEDFKVKLKKIPNSAGIYIFKDTKNKPLYIGKASDLKNRVKYYFKTADVRLQKMVAAAKKLDYIQTDSDIEALILESQYIKKHQPPFNIIMRDDKQYGFVGFTHSTHSTRSQGGTSNESQSNSEPAESTSSPRPELGTKAGQTEKYSKIFITHQPFDSAERRRRVVLSVSKDNRSVSLRASPVKYIGPFTDIGALKTALRYLRKIFPYCTCKQLHHNYCLNYHIGKCPGFCCFKQQKPDPQITTDNQQQYRKNIEAIKDILSGKKNSLLKNLKKEMVALGKKEEFEKAMELQNKIEKLKRVLKNAQIIKNFPYYDTSNNHSGMILCDLKKTLGLRASPLRIEGYDVANIQGKYAVGAMAVFILQHDSGQINWKPDKNEYRKFKILQTAKNSKLYLSHDREINTVSKPTQFIPPTYRGDVGMLKEILTRRLKHSEWRYPDLILVDGGKAQLNAAVVALKDLRLKNGDLRIIALTKDEKHKGTKFFIDGKKEPTSLSKLPTNVKNLFLRINAEAHRFAINYYRKLHRDKIKLKS